MWDVGLYEGVVRDHRDPSKKIISGERFNPIKLSFCALSVFYCTSLVASAERLSYCLQVSCLRLRKRERFWRFWECRGRSLTNVCGGVSYKRTQLYQHLLLLYLLVFRPRGVNGELFKIFAVFLSWADE